MEMELVGVLKVIWRWLWFIVLVVAITCALLYFNPSFSVVDYRADVVLLFSTPDREDVAAFDDYIFTNDRDEISSAINKFVEISQYPEVKRRTLEALGINEAYDVVVNPELGADFVTLTVAANTPELAARIANAHAATAIAFYGEIRSMPATQATGYFDSQLATAELNLQNAETALNNFQIENNVVSLESEQRVQYQVLQELEVTRAQMRIYQVTSGHFNPADSTQVIAVTDTDISNVDALISEQRLILSNLALLQAEFDNLQSDVERTRERYNYILDQQNIVETRQSFSSQASFIQIIQPASLPTSPEDKMMQTLLLGGIGSLGLAILFAFLFDYILKRW